MKRVPERLACFFAVLLFGCGSTGQEQPDAGVDVRAAFLGTWSGQAVTTYTISGQTQQSQQNTTWQLEDSTISGDRVSWRTAACDYQAKVTGDSSFVIDPVTCRPQTSDAGCSVTFTINNGTGTRTGTSLSVTLGGSIVGQCTGGGPQNGTLTSRFDGAKQ